MLQNALKLGNDSIHNFYFFITRWVKLNYLNFDIVDWSFKDKFIYNPLGEIKLFEF